MIIFLASCSFFSDIPDFVDEIIPDEIDGDFVLEEKHLDYNLRYYLNDVEITDYKIDFPYLLEDTKYTIKLGVHSNFTSKT
ncbi:MAG TPA: hypothetical protein VK005_02125, partial [Acholeplasma sp.]|nr:hypothetical protein [Acholeplasma sp.]